MTARMVDSTADFHRIRPHKILCVIIPCDVKLLLAYGAGQTSQIIITRHRDKLGFGVILRCSCSRYRLRVLRPIRGTTRAIFFVRPRSDPFLEPDISLAPRTWGDILFLPARLHTSSGFVLVWQNLRDADWCENASQDVGPSFSDLRLCKETAYRR